MRSQTSSRSPTLSTLPARASRRRSSRRTRASPRKVSGVLHQGPAATSRAGGALATSAGRAAAGAGGLTGPADGGVCGTGGGGAERVGGLGAGCAGGLAPAGAAGGNIRSAMEVGCSGRGTGAGAGGGTVLAGAAGCAPAGAGGLPLGKGDPPRRASRESKVTSPSGEAAGFGAGGGGAGASEDSRRASRSERVNASFAFSALGGRGGFALGSFSFGSCPLGIGTTSSPLGPPRALPTSGGTRGGADPWRIRRMLAHPPGSFKALRPAIPAPPGGEPVEGAVRVGRVVPTPGQICPGFCRMAGAKPVN